MGNDEIKKIKSQKFFADLSRVYTQSAPTNPNDLSEKIVLKASISNIDKSATYAVQIFSIFGNQNNPLNESQLCIVDDITNTAVLNSSIVVQYYFEREQPLMVVINKTGGTNPRRFEIRTTLGCVMGSRKNTLVKNIPEASGEILNLGADKLKDSEEILIFRLGNQSKINFKETKNKLVYHMMNSSKGPIYNSECINNNGLFNEVKIPSGILKQGIILSFINNKKKVIHEAKTNIEELINQKQFSFNKYHFVSNSILTKTYTFVDYLKAGVQLGLSIAIDFTGSNGNPNDPRSLHYISGQEPNQYERAIYACGNIMAYYDYDQLFPCYGFGAKIKNIIKLLLVYNFGVPLIFLLLLNPLMILLEHKMIN